MQIKHVCGHREGIGRRKRTLSRKTAGARELRPRRGHEFQLRVARGSRAALRPALAATGPRGVADAHMTTRELQVPLSCNAIERKVVGDEAWTD